MKRTLVPLLLLGLSAPASCKKAESSHHHEPAAAHDEHADSHHEGEHPPLSRKVRLPEKVIADAAIATEPVTRRALTTSVELSGEIVADPDRQAFVPARIAGRIERVLFREGDEVKKGQLLAVVRAPELGELRSTYLAASARAAAARANAERLRSLAENRFAAEQEILAAETEAQSFEAEARAAGEKLAALGMPLPKGNGAASSTLELRAPLDGVVVARDAIVGQPVDADHTVATIVDLREVFFVAKVFEHALPRVRTGARAEVELSAHPGERFTGTLDYLGPRIDPDSRTVTARIALPNEDRALKLGLFGSARIESDGDSARPSLVIPRDAVTEIAGRKVAFVETGSGEYEAHDLELGASAVGQVEVLSGLREGEKVVVQGLFTLKSAVLRGSIGDDH